MTLNRSYQVVLAALFTLAIAAPSQAGVMQKFVDEGWTEFQDAHDGGGVEDGNIGPGVGGQPFDAEYLFYKWDGSVLSIALQTGFDVLDGHYKHTDNRHYYSGDLALSFDGDVDLGDGTTYEYGADFGLFTKSYGNGTNNNYNPHNVDFTGGAGIDAAGLYAVDTWDNDVVAAHAISNPFAIDSIDAAQTATDFDLGDLGFGTTAAKGTLAGETSSYYRIVSFDTSAFNIDIEAIDVHWTMSCGNDNIRGTIDSINVPEPESLAIVLLGLVGLFAARVRTRKLQFA